jgi:hypothetical protein
MLATEMTRRLEEAFGAASALSVEEQNEQRRPFSGRRWTVLYFPEVEAPGIEPGSENRSTTATTCVVCR